MKIIKVPFDHKTTGVKEAPDAILKHLADFFLTETGNSTRYDPTEIRVMHGSIVDTNTYIENAITNLDSKAIILGGEHHITYACMKAFAQKYPGAGIVIFDAHPDAENKFAPPNQEDLLIMLIKERVVTPDRVIILGRRNWTENEKGFLDEHKIRCYSMKHIHEVGVQNVCEGLMETVSKWGALYVSIDIDVVDPAYAPGNGYLEPGGLTSREMIYFCQRLKLLKNFMMADICEVNPKLDVRDMTTRLAAKLVKELS